jgi:hypothetical protein
MRGHGKIDVRISASVLPDFVSILRQKADRRSVSHFISKKDFFHGWTQQMGQHQAQESRD